MQLVFDLGPLLCYGLWKKSSSSNLSFLNLCLSAAVPRGLYDTLASGSPLLFGVELLQ